MNIRVWLGILVTLSILSATRAGAQQDYATPDEVIGKVRKAAVLLAEEGSRHWKQ